MPSSRGCRSSYDCIVKIKGVTTRPNSSVYLAAGLAMSAVLSLSLVCILREWLF